MVVDAKTSYPEKGAGSIKKNKLATLLKAIALEIGKEITHKLATPHTKRYEAVALFGTT